MSAQHLRTRSSEFVVMIFQYNSWYQVSAHDGSMMEKYYSSKSVAVLLDGTKCIKCLKQKDWELSELTRWRRMLVVSVMSAAQHEEDSRGLTGGGAPVSSHHSAAVTFQKWPEPGHQSVSQCSHALNTSPMLSIITVQPTTALLISPVTAAIDWCRPVIFM